MAPAPSAGILLWRRGEAGPEVLIGHMGGPLWARKDDAGWSIPKGEYEPGEDALAAARREFTEETGHPVPGTEPVDLGEIRQPSGKLVRIWAVEGDLDAQAVVSNLFSMEWPPRSGRFAEFPEIDRAGWFPLPVAAVKLVRGQVPFLTRLADLVGPAGSA